MNPTAAAATAGLHQLDLLLLVACSAVLMGARFCKGAKALALANTATRKTNVDDGILMAVVAMWLGYVRQECNG